MRWSYTTFQDGTELAFSETGDDGRVGVWAKNDARQRSAHFVLSGVSDPDVVCDFSDGYAADKLHDVAAFVAVNASLILEMSRRETKRSDDASIANDLTNEMTAQRDGRSASFS